MNRWGGGLDDWWRGLFGLPAASSEERDEVSGGIIPAEPPAGKGKLEDAVYDFLNSWLVEGRPNIAVSYMSERAYECLELEQEEPLDRGMAPFILMKGMADAKQVIGPKSSLAEATIGVRLVDPSLRLIENPHHAQFVLYDVAEDVASSFQCINRTEAVSQDSADRPRRFGKYYGSIFYLEGPARGDTLALLWEKENGIWKIVSYEVEPAGEEIDTPDLRPTEPTEAVEIQRTDGDARFISVTEDFVRSWLVEKNIDQAFGTSHNGRIPVTTSSAATTSRRHSHPRRPGSVFAMGWSRLVSGYRRSRAWSKSSRALMCRTRPSSSSRTRTRAPTRWSRHRMRSRKLSIVPREPEAKRSPRRGSRLWATGTTSPLASSSASNKGRVRL